MDKPVLSRGGSGGGGGGAFALVPSPGSGREPASSLGVAQVRPSLLPFGGGAQEPPRNLRWPCSPCFRERLCTQGWMPLATGHWVRSRTVRRVESHPFSGTFIKENVLGRSWVPDTTGRARHLEKTALEIVQVIFLLDLPPALPSDPARGLC